MIAAGSRSISSSIEANFVEDDVMFFELSEDLILEIFSHLPPISILRFKSVSKTWYSLISNPDFLRRNTANQFDRRRWIRINYDFPPPNISLKRYQLAEDSRILILPYYPPPPPNPNDNDNIDQPNYYCHKKLSPLLLQNLIDYSPEHDDDNGVEKGKFQLLDSCNGLLLYGDGFRKYPIPHRGGKQQQYRWYVCNPITQDYIKLPTLFEQEETEQGFRIFDHSSPNIVFDPLVSLTYEVLTWLICIHDEEKEEHYQLYVYSSKTRSWRLSVSTNQLLVPHPLTSIWRGVLCSGVLYWTTKYPSFRTNVTLRYDVEKDVISTLNFPKMPLEYSYRVLLYFGECGGRLRLIETYYKETHMQWQHGGGIDVFPSIFDVMELDNNDDLWTVKYRVNIGDDQKGCYYTKLIRKQRITLFCIHILYLYKSKTKKKEEEEEEEEEVLLLSINNIGIIPFNLSSNTFGKELRHGDFMDFMEVVRYNTITLFPPSSSL